LAVVRGPQDAAEPLGVLAFRGAPRENDPDVRGWDVDPLVENLGRYQHRIFASPEPFENLGAFIGLRLVGDTGNDELLGDVVGEVVVGGEDDRPVVVMALDEIVERVEFLFGGASDSLGPLLGDECPSALRVVGGTLEELLVALLFPEVELVAVDVVTIDLVLFVVLLALVGRDLYDEGQELLSEIRERLQDGDVEVIKVE